MAELRDRLQTALGAGYRVDKELGGGGMSRVFLAEEVRLGRRVVVKVLPPEMSAGVSVERFEREIQLAAKLQHPHIVPLLTAGSSDDLLYYVMPFIDGESLRVKLAREGELPVPDTLRILRDVLDALAYAHRQHVVHRDIKPDNVLLAEGHALVTDFGVAKAVSESTGGHSLTSLGVALGTPLYMAPEQAAANPNIDHRADLYAVGVMAYETLCGRPPFMGPNPQAVLSAHVTQAPEPCTTHRPAIPPALNTLVMKCLEKHPADRWQRAEELLPHVEAMLTPTGGITPTGTQPVSAVDYDALARRAHPVRVAALFGLASAAVLAVVYGIMVLLGLPDWVFLGAVALLAIGLPIMLTTGHQERQRALARTSGMTVTTPTGVKRYFTWRRSLRGGALAFGGLAVVATGYTGMRLLGIGPIGTLLARGALGNQERIIVADFENATADSALGETVTDLFRIALAQSRIITVMERSQVADVLVRMRRDRNARLTPDLAAEVATREGVKAFVAGEIRPVGGDYIVSARVVAAGTGDGLVAVSEPASGSAGLIKAVDRVSARLRERIGESLRSVRADPPLEQVTTTSLEALRLYAQATRLADQGDADRAIALLAEAVKRDTLFGMAHRRLGAYMTNPTYVSFLGTPGREALSRAYQLRERLSDGERYHVEAMYASRVENDNEKAITAYLALLDKHPNDATALNNLAVSYAVLHRSAERDAAYRRTIATGVAPALTYTNLLNVLRFQGNLVAADSLLRVFGEKFPASPETAQWASNLAAGRMDFQGAAETVAPLLEAPPALRVFARNRLAAIAQIHGRLEESTRHRDEAVRVDAQRRGMSPEERDMLLALNRAERAAWFGPDPGVVAGEVESLWRRNQRLTEGRDVTGRRHPQFIAAFARARRPLMARRLLDELRSAMSERDLEDYFVRTQLRDLEGDVLLAEERPGEAAAAYRAIRRDAGTDCVACVLAKLGYAHDQAGSLDSALLYYQRYVETPGGRVSPGPPLIAPDELWLAPTLRRLGELYEQRGDRGKALDYYSRFIELWKDADPELQPVVRDVRGRMARLAGEQPR